MELVLRTLRSKKLPVFKSQYPLHRKRERTWQVLVIMPVQGTPIGARVRAPIGAEIISVDGEGSIGGNDREIGAPIGDRSQDIV